MKIKVLYKSLKFFRPYARNPRKNDAAVDRMVASIREYGFAVPVLATSEGELIAGHLRLKAAQKLGMKELPVIICDGWTEAQIQAFRLIENRSASWAEWDDELLKLEFEELKEFDFDLELTGFDEGEIEHLLLSEPKKVNAKVAVKTSKTLDELAPNKEERALLAGKKLLVEFSGGKDSSASAIWSKHYFPKNEIELMFVDLGADYVGFHLHLHRFAESLGLPLIILRSEQTVLECFLRKGCWPHFAHPYCHVLLLDAFHGHITKHDRDSCVIVRGGKMGERTMPNKTKAKKSRITSIDRHKGYVAFNPVYFTDKDACAEILRLSGAPIWGGYDYGLGRTCCRICPGQKARSYAAIRANFPDVWDELGRLEGRFGAGCWQRHDSIGHLPVKQMADHGQAAFDEGGFKRTLSRNA